MQTRGVRADRSGSRRWAVVAGVGPAAAGLVVLGRAAGLLDGAAGLAFAVLLLVAIPVSRELSRRLLLTGVAVLGWLPVLWWFRIPVDDVGRVTLALAATAGALSAWVAHGPVRKRMVSLVPRVRLVDLWPMGAGVAASAFWMPWALVQDAAGALSMLARGWDHSAHFFMSETIRRSGVVLDRLGVAPGGDEWAYRRYPQGFHTLAAAGMELILGPRSGSPDVELLAYSHVMFLIAVVGVVVVVAGACAVPRLRRAPLAALPLAVLVTVAFVVGPGGHALTDGFPNFLLAATLAATVPVLVVHAARVGTASALAALGGAAVGVAHTWILLLVLLAPAVLALGLPVPVTRWRMSRRDWSWAGSITVATALGIGYAAVLLADQDLGEVLVIGGGVTPPSTSTVVVLAGMAMAVAAGLRVPSVGGGLSAHRRRLSWLGLVPLVGTGAAAAVAWLQIGANGHVGYYFWKLAIALALVAVTTFVTVVSPHVRPERRHGRAWRAAAALVAAAGLTQVFGVVFPRAQMVGLTSAPASLTMRAELELACGSPSKDVMELLDGLAVPPDTQGRHMVFLPSPDGAELHPISATQWYLALSGTWTSEANVTAALVGEGAIDEVAAGVLAGDHVSVVVVPHDLVDQVRRGVPATERDRVLSW